MKKTVSFLLCIVLILGLSVLPSAAAGGEPEATTNYSSQNYAKWADPVNSYLFENPGGGLTRVEYADGRIIVEDYDSSFRYLSGQTLAMELPIWGGFFAGQKYNYLLEGQNNEAEDDSVEVFRIIQYDKSWKRIGSTGLYGANTYHPVDAGSARFAEYGDDLYIRTCHEMYASSDGLNHQASVTIAVRQSDLTITDSWYSVMNISYGYVSHSFNQFVVVDQEKNIVCADHGDAYPRSAVLMRYPTKAGNGKFTASYSNPVRTVDVQEYGGAHGDNTTGATVGGLAATSRGYLVAHTYDGVGGGGTQLPYLSFVDKDSFQVTTRALPYENASCPPMLVSTGTDTGYVLWNLRNISGNPGWYYIRYDSEGNKIRYLPDPVHEDDTLYYVTYQADGSFGSVQTAADAPLSDCQPIVYRGDVVWYVTDKSAPTFYVLSSAGVKTYTADGSLPSAPGDIASVTVTPSSGGKISLKWSASENASAYILQRHELGSDKWTTLASDIKGTTYTDTSGEAGVVYQYRVRGRNGDSFGPYRTSAEVACMSGSAPGSVGTPAVKPSSGGKITVSWKAASGAATYILQRNERGSSAWTTLGSNIKETKYTDTTAKLGKVYRYRVRSRNVSVFGPFKVSAEAAAMKGSAPGAVSGVTVTAAKKKITVSWGAAEGAASYIVQRRERGSDTWTTLNSNVKETSYVDTTGTVGAVYQYRVRSRNVSTYGPFKAGTEVAFMSGSTPGDISKVTVKATSGKITVTWTASSGAAGYIVQRRVKGGTWENLSTNVTELSYVDKTAKAGTTYQYRVRPRNGSIYGSFKAGAEVTAK